MNAKILLRRSLSRLLTPFRFFFGSLAGGVIAYFYKNRIPFGGLVFDTSSPEISPVIKSELYLRVYEFMEINLIRKHLPDFLEVIELGSSMGVVSCLVRKRLRKELRMICVEAHPALVKQTRENLKLNQLDYNVEFLNKAVNYVPSGVFFTPGLLSIMGTLTYGKPRHNSLPVESVTLSDIKSTYGIKEFTLIADIEGVEADIIRKDKEALSFCRHLFLELHDTIHNGQTLSAGKMLRELIDAHGFRLKERQGNAVYLTRA